MTLIIDFRMRETFARKLTLKEKKRAMTNITETRLLLKL
jgi:hypothetical protein